ncbi:MAG: hypothetical protein KF784_10745 [Fimbriimonadaceae bacterium]|nr:hypothetical protein [Fimbriimonadaceae bacterium]
MKLVRLVLLLMVLAAFVVGLAQNQPTSNKSEPAQTKAEKATSQKESGEVAGHKDTKEKEPPEAMSFSLAVWANAAQILATIGVLLGIIAYFRQRKIENEQGIVTRYRECTSQLLGYFEGCQDFKYRDHVFDIAGIIPKSLSDEEYKRTIKFQILLTHLEESHLLYEHPENHMQLMSRRVWLQTLFLWLRNEEFQGVSIFNRGYLSGAYYRSIDLFIAIHRAYGNRVLPEIEPEDADHGGWSYTADPRLEHYIGQSKHIHGLARLSEEYALKLGIAPVSVLFPPSRTTRNLLFFDDGSYIVQKENPVQFAILQSLLLENDSYLDELRNGDLWNRVAKQLDLYIRTETGKPITTDPLYQLVR